MKFNIKPKMFLFFQRGVGCSNNSDRDYKQFSKGSGGLGGVFSSKLAPVDCKTDREIEGELLEYGVKFPQKMAANGLRETWKLLTNMSEDLINNKESR